MRHRININQSGANEVTIDEKAVYLPKASTSGFGKYMAKPGHLITYTQERCLLGESTTIHVTDTGRVIGRIMEVHYGCTITPGHLLVLQISDNMHHSFFRVIDPSDVTSCIEMPSKHLSWFAGPMPKPETLASMVCYGSTSESYIEGAEGEAVARKARLEYLRSPEGVAEGERRAKEARARILARKQLQDNPTSVPVAEAIAEAIMAGEPGPFDAFEGSEEAWKEKKS